MNQIGIKDIMSKAISIAKSASVTEALDKMLAEGADPLIVTQNGSVIGTVSRKSIAEIMGSRRNSNLSPNAIHVATTVEDDFTSAYPDQGIDVAIPLLQRYKLVVVLDREHRLLGQVTTGDMLKVVKPQVAVEEMLEPAHSILADERVVHLRRRMLDEGISKFIVKDNSGIIGIVTETDVATAMRSFREVVEDKYQDHRIRNMIVRDIMSAPVLTMEVSTGIEAMVDTMLKKGISSIPVTRNGVIEGLVTRHSVIQAL
ncbi:MAG: CBS domain-containing protein [Methanomicrobiales archaeon]|nr:CBS domain-containing protein [Methanomicrobiales archaeon]